VAPKSAINTYRRLTGLAKLSLRGFRLALPLFAPAPCLERVFAEREPGRADHPHAHEETERGRRLDEARVIAPLGVGHVLGDVGGRASVLAAERETLEQAQENEEHRGDEPDAGVRG
jgi:hypothetical protein